MDRQQKTRLLNKPLAAHEFVVYLFIAARFMLTHIYYKNEGKKRKKKGICQHRGSLIVSAGISVPFRPGSNFPVSGESDSL